MRSPITKISLVALCLALLSATPVLAQFEGCQKQVELGVPGDDGVPLCRKGYALAHNPDTKTPFWVAEYLTRSKALAEGARSNRFKSDPDLPIGERAELKDYKHSGFDRGHMAASANMNWDEEANAESYYLSNMAPQVGDGMNSGIWKELESDVRIWAVRRGRVFIFTGPIYANQRIRRIGSNKVGVPTHFYKIVYDPDETEAIAFIMPNKKLKTSDMPNYIVSVRTIEQQTGLKFFDSLGSESRRRLISSTSPSLWKTTAHQTQYVDE